MGKGSGGQGQGFPQGWGLGEKKAWGARGYHVEQGWSWGLLGGLGSQDDRL